MLKKFYHKLCLLKARKIADAAQDYVEGSLLDVGSGRGHIAQEIQKRKNNKVQLLDVKDLNETKLPYTLFDGERIPFEDNSFDTLLVCYVLHHTKDPAKLLRECARVSRKRIIIFEDNPKSLLTKPLDVIFNKLHGVATPLNFKTIEEWRQIFKEHKLSVTSMQRGVEKEWFYPGVEHIMFVVDKVK